MWTSMTRHENKKQVYGTGVKQIQVNEQLWKSMDAYKINVGQRNLIKIQGGLYEPIISMKINTNVWTSMKANNDMKEVEAHKSQY